MLRFFLWTKTVSLKFQKCMVLSKIDEEFIFPLLKSRKRAKERWEVQEGVSSVGGEDRGGDPIK